MYFNSQKMNQMFSFYLKKSQMIFVLLLITFSASAEDDLTLTQLNKEKKYIESINQSLLESDQPEKINNAIRLAEIYLSQGDFDKALNILLWLKPDIKNVSQPDVLTKYYGNYARSLRFSNRYKSAIDIINVGLFRVEITNRPLLRASLLNDLGGIYISSERYRDAEKAFDSAYQLVQGSGDNELISIISINLVSSLIWNNKSSGLEGYLRDAEAASQLLKNTSDKANHYLSLGRLYRKFQITFSLSQQWRAQALRLFNIAQKIADKNNDKRLLSYANGYTGQLYEDEKRFDDALHYTRKAIFFAQEARSVESLYRWEWQSARILRDMGQTDAAIVFYKQAINTLTAIRSDLTKGSKNTFQQLVGPIYYEFTDLLLRQTDGVQSEQQLQVILADVQNTVEQLKAAEIEDYFDNECVLPNNLTQLKTIKHSSAVIYPVILQDRLEIVINIGGVFYRKTTKVPAKKLITEIKRLRSSIESYSENTRYLEYSQNIYQWLIEPLESVLKNKNIKTLVFVPDGALRSIPMSVLYDGSEFLVQKYAVAITPGLNMTDVQSFNRKNLNILATGISESVQGFAALPSVVTEINNLKKIVKSRTFINKEFVLDSINKEMQRGDFSVVHIATHGEFNRDHNKTFLLTYDDKLTLPKLQSLISNRSNNESPIELLVLSACQTAKGDERAALGLAGVAIRAGAKSALATLWYISDDATSVLITEFYQQLKNPNLSKSEALRVAQLKLIKSDKFQHPVYWAPFILIGNWL